jgi:hypothetical protein
MHRGNESTEHQDMKRVIGKLLVLLGWLVVFEEKLCDVVAWRICANGRVRILGIEAERSSRNAIRNVTKDFSRRCDALLIVAVDEKMRRQIRRLLKRRLPRSVWTRVGIITYATCSALLAREAPAPPTVMASLLKD